MAGVFKSLDQSDIRVVPFRAHKQWANDLSYSLASVPNRTVSIAYNLKSVQTNFSQSINVGNNYYYYVSDGGNIYRNQGSPDYIGGGQTTNSPRIVDYLSSAGQNQDLVMYYDILSSTMCAHLATNLSNVDVGSFGLVVSSLRNTTWLPGGDIVLLSCEENTPSDGLVAVEWSEGAQKFLTSSTYSTNPSTNYLGTTFAVRSGSSSNFFAAYTTTATLDEVYFEYKNQSGSIINDTSGASQLSYTPLAIKDFVSNGDLASLSSFATMKDGTGLWLINGNNNTVQFQKYDYDVVRLLQDKDLYRNGSYNTARTFAVLRDGRILCDLYANNSGYGWQDEIDARRLVGDGYIIAATINKNVDLLSETQPLTITVYGVTNLTTKAPIVVFSINMDTQEISDPIHLGCHNTEGSSPFLGDDGNTSINFIGDNSINKVVGFMYQTDVVDVSDGSVYSKIYIFNT